MFDKIKRFIGIDSSVLVPGHEQKSSYDPFNYTSSLILYKMNDSKKTEHREAQARYEPIAHFICHTIPENTFDDGFEWVDDSGNTIDSISGVIKEMEHLDWRQAFTQADKYARIFGWSAIYFAEAVAKSSSEEELSNLLSTPMRGASGIGRLQVYAGERDISVYATDAQGNPTKYRIVQKVKQGNVSVSKEYFVDPSRIMVITPVPIRFGQVAGESVLDSIWEPMISRQNIRYSMTYDAAKYGGGTALFKLTEDARGWTQDDINRLEVTVKDMGQRQGMVIPYGVDMKYDGPSRNVDYVQRMDSLLEDIAIGSRIPKDILKGASAGALTGSELNQMNYFSLISANQARYEKYINLFAIRINPSITSVVEAAIIKWKMKFQMSEREQADVEYRKAETNVLLLNYLTVNEVRELADYDAVDESQESMMRGVQPDRGEDTPPVAPVEAQKDASKFGVRRDERIKQVITFANKEYAKDFRTFGELDAYLIGLGRVKRFIKEVGLSNTTYYNWRRDRV